MNSSTSPTRTTHLPSLPPNPGAPGQIYFIGGGNMASAIVGGLLRQGHPAAALHIVEPWDEQRERLAQQFPGVAVHPNARGLVQAGTPDPATQGEQPPQSAHIVVWAVKPQTFKQAALESAPHLPAHALHLSVAAGIRTESMARWLGSERIVRAMPNTPALVGLGMTGLYARAGVSAAEREQVQALLAGTGRTLWLPQESDLDAVTALSGSGPAYVFYFLEAMRRAGTELGLSPAAASELAIGTFVGAAQLAQSSSEPPEVLRQRVTSKGGTTHAALSVLEAAQVADAFVAAIAAAHRRAREMGDEFGG
ncbi:pyrroline-5-carboxylate reductase [Serpentinimonas barnesii]|uniref:pyrroline-5-carboxylate reductase n=1 Tax=Serpentinimonas barnesii TaxID=1458427 RepID=UPI00097165F7|nr:pyrroline-5-carboxylate reductase [Serpentinimonas barnesii]